MEPTVTPATRIPPHNLDAEASVLGSILLDNDAYHQLEGTVRAEMFYKEAHRKIFNAMEDLITRGSPVDTITIVEELRVRGQIDEVGGVAYLVGLADVVPTSVYADHYARIVVQKALLRSLIGAAGKIMQLAYDESGPADELMDRAEKLIFEIASAKRIESFSGMKELVNDTFELIENLAKGAGIHAGVQTGFKELDEMTTGLQPGSLNVLAARPSMGKCLTAGTLVDVPGSGERLTIEEFVRRREKRVYGLSEAGRLRPTAVSAWIDSGVKPVRRVTTRTGRQVETTLHHPFLGVDGWTPLYDLKPGDRIAVPRALPTFGDDSEYPVELARLTAYLIAEGGLTDSSPEWTNTDPELIADFLSILAHHFPEVTPRRQGISFVLSSEWRPGERKNRPNPLTEWLRGLGLWGKGSAEKRFPAVAWRWDEERLAAFLRVLFSCDATIYAIGAARRPRIEFTVASEGLARDVQHALTRFGVIAKLWRKTERSWRVEVTEARSVAEYQERIGWLGEKDRRRFEPGSGDRSNVGHLPPAVWRRVRAAAEGRGLSLSGLARQTGENTGPGFNAHTGRGLPQSRLAAYAAVLEDPQLAMLASPEIYWDEIVSIEDLGAVQVYDLTVPDGANFVANDVCVHNTAFALSIAQNVAIRGGKTVAVFSLEMPAVQLVLRMLCSEARVDMNRVRLGQLQDRDFERLVNAADRLSRSPMFIDDAPDLNVIELRSRARRLMAEHDLGLIVIDYMQLMQATPGRSSGSENRQQEISNISRGLKALARELNIPVMVLSQLSRQVEQRPNHRPMLSDLRESGAIEQDADLVAFIYRDEYYNKETDQQGIAEIIIGKQRNGPVGTVKLQFHSQHVRFNDLAHERV
ncbi:MAG TPA: replicative DNA helicase [Deinococcales bacterium]|nr:replicative DNA helicase [Deinococcales bacterium]